MRQDNIKEKLKYISSKINDLGDVLFKAKMEGTDINDVAHSVGDILANSTELFDYCAQDIFEKFISPYNSSFSKKKIYFPFYSRQLTEGKEPFSYLKFTSPQLHTYLLKLTNDSDTGVSIENTCVPASFPRKIRDLVNNKKHIDVIDVTKEGQGEYVIETNGMKVTLPIQQEGFKIGEPNLVGNIKINKTKAYELKETGEEVTELCIYNKTATEKIITEIYKRF